MNIQIVIPAYNESGFIEQTLSSLVAQSLLPTKVVVVDDGSTDNTVTIVQRFIEQYNFIYLIQSDCKSEHAPGTKVVNAFYRGFTHITSSAQLIGKFDADVLLPTNYLETLSELFKQRPKLGLASGLLYVKSKDNWIFENIADKNHVRGPIKLYRKECFNDIEGLRKSIGWDTVDTLLAAYHSWEVQTVKELVVRHLKPTGISYTSSNKYKQGEAMYKMRYGIWITFIAAIKIAFLKKSPRLIYTYAKGYYLAWKRNTSFIVSKKEGKFIRNLRWKRIFKKIRKII